MTMTASTPTPILSDPMVAKIRERARIVRKQIAASTDPTRTLRLTGLYDAYVVDLQDAVRIAASRTGRRNDDRTPVDVSRQAIEDMLDS